MIEDQYEDDDYELPDGEDNIEEANGHDPEKAETQSIDSVGMTDDIVKKAPARKGDKTKQDKMDKSKDSEKSKEMPEHSYDFPGELEDLVESEATLSDEFKAKSAIIFETAIRSKISEEVERLEDEYQEKLDEELQATREELVDNVDNYLNYVVENWMEENRVAVETGLRAEIAEDFMNGLKDLFVESYIDVPETQVDLVDELAEKIEELEEKLNSRTHEVLSMSEELESFQRESIIREHSRDLAETEVEKLNSLVENLDFENEETFADKVKTVKESYFKKDLNSDTQELEEDWSDETTEHSPLMNKYLESLRNSNKK